MSKVKSVVIACPTFGLNPNPNEWLSTFLGVLNEFSVRGFKVNTYFPYRTTIVEAENAIVHAAITNGADYIFRMDDDIWGYQNGFVNKMIDADKEYISGVMYVSGFPYSKCAFVRTDKTKTLPEIYSEKILALTEVEGRGVIPVDLTGSPFTLMKTSIFEKIKTPYFQKQDGVAMDSMFCQKLLDAGIQPYVHMDVMLNHRHVTPWNRHYLFNAEARAMLQSGMVDKNSPLYPILASEFGEKGDKDPLMLKAVRVSE